jgi:hypothetical protein
LTPWSPSMLVHLVGVVIIWGEQEPPVYGKYIT